MTLVVIALAWLLPFGTISLWGTSPWMGAAWISAGAPLVLSRLGPRTAPVLAAAVIAALAGGYRYQGWVDQPLPGLSAYVGHEVTVSGVIASEPDPGLTTRAFRIDADRVSARGVTSDTAGAVRATLSQFTELDRGARVEVTGRLELPPVFPDFDYRGYLARQGVVGTMLFPRVRVMEGPSPWDARARVSQVRLALEGSLQRNLPEPEASLGAGIAFGRDDGLPRDVYDEFRDTGLAHIVAVSGSNVAILTLLVFALATRLVPRYWAIVPAMTAVAAYVVVAGVSASVVRAGIMAIVMLAGMWLGRPRSSLAALGAAAIVMTALDPGSAKDLGFQLSLAATGGLIVFAPWIRWLLQRGLQRGPFAGLVPDGLLYVVAVTLSATLATAPIVWVSFGRFSVIGPLANVVVEPVFVLAFALSGIAAVAGTAWQPAGWAVSLLAYYPLAFITWFARTAADLPFAAVDVPKGSAWAGFVAYLALGAAAWPAYRHLPPEAPQRPKPATALPRRAARIALGGGFGAAVVFVTLMPLGGPGELEMTVLNIGQGDAILLTTPGGHQALFDSGPSGVVLARQLGAVLPHWDRHIDAVFLTHPQLDHEGGFPALFERFDVDTAHDTGVRNPTDADAAYASGRPAMRRLVRGDVVTLDGVRFEVLWPPDGIPARDLNATSLVVRVTYGGTSILLTGDIEANVQDDIVAGGKAAATILKVPHHGSKTSAPAFFTAVHPSVAVISVGAGNPFGHPSPETLEALAGVPTYRTDLQGRLTIRSDGTRVRVSTER